MRLLNKYTLMTLGSSPQILDLPEGAEILDVQMQHGQARLWALVDPTVPTEEVKI